MSYKSLHAALTQNHHCSLTTRNDRKDCSSCHGELYSKIVSLALLFPGEDEDLRGVFVPFFIGPCPSIKPKPRCWAGGTKVWCFLLILKIHEDKSVSFPPCSLHLKK